MIKDINIFFSDEYAEKCAEEIVNKFSNGKNDPETETVDYEYDLQKGEIVIDEGEYTKNTSYMFDPEPSSPLRNIIEAFIHDDETRLPEIGDFEKLDEFLKEKVSKIIEEKYSNKMKETARVRVLGGAPEEIFPISNFKMLEISLHDFGRKYKVRLMRGIKVKKEVLKNAKDTKDILSNKPRSKSVGEEIADIHDETGKSFEQIIAEKKALGDPEYDEVLGAQKVRAFYDCYVDMWFDYSIKKPESEYNQLL